MISVDVIRPVFSQMEGRDRLVLELYYEDGETLKSIGSILSEREGRDEPISRQRVHQIKNRAIDRALDMTLGRKCFRCARMYTLMYAASGRQKIRCPRCGSAMDTVPGRDVSQRQVDASMS